MSLTDRLKDLLVKYPHQTSDRSELERLREFTERMREAGIVPTRTYDLPLPNTLGSGLVVRSRAHSS